MLLQSGAVYVGGQAFDWGRIADERGASLIESEQRRAALAVLTARSPDSQPKVRSRSNGAFLHNSSGVSGHLRGADAASVVARNRRPSPRMGIAPHSPSLVGLVVSGCWIRRRW